MLSFFYKGHRFFIAFAGVCSIVWAFFFFIGEGDKKGSFAIDGASYLVGKKGIKGGIVKGEIEAMKQFLSYDFGYGFNDVLQKQNVFGGGFFIDLIHSSFGDELIKRFFPLIKGDFAKRVDTHKRFGFYKDPSGKFFLEQNLKERAKPFYDLYKKVTLKGRKVDEELFKDYIALCFMQKSITPAFMQNLVSSSMKFMGLPIDETVNRRNFALFSAKNNEEIFGEAFIEICAQVLLQCGNYLEQRGYNTPYEEAKGVIIRKAMGEITEKYHTVEEISKLKEILHIYQENLGIREEELIGVCQKLMNFQKMLKDMDNAILVDKSTICELFSDSIQKISATVIKDSDLLRVKSVEDALLLQCYLESIGEVNEFLSPPLNQYPEEKIEQIAPSLFTKKYELKIALVKKSLLGGTIPLKMVWDFQTCQTGWDLIREKFGLEDINKGERFAFFQNLDEEKKRVIEEYARQKLVEEDDLFFKKGLDKQPLRLITFDFNKRVNSNFLYEGIDEIALQHLLEEKNEGDTIDFYTQDGEHYFTIYIVKKGQKQIACFSQAKQKGYLKPLLDSKLEKLSGANRSELLQKLLLKEGGEQVYKKILESEKEGKVYAEKMVKRLENFDVSCIQNPSALLAPFAIEKSKQIITKSGKNGSLWKMHFLGLKKGDESALEYEQNNIPYKIIIDDFLLDEEKVDMYVKAVGQKIAGDQKDEFYFKLFSHIQDNDLLDRLRVTKEQAL
jgi:hypothetical protein